MILGSKRIKRIVDMDIELISEDKSMRWETYCRLWSEL